MFAEISNIDLLVNLTLALITFSLGLTLTKHDFSNLLLNPKSLTIGLFAQILILPAVTVLIMYYTDIDPIWKMGFFIISICPSGISSNLVSFMMNGNTALSISLTVFNAVITLITIPFFTNLALDFFLNEQSVILQLPFWTTFLTIFFITILPTIIGIFFRASFKEVTQRIRPVLKYVLPLMLFLIFTLKIFVDKSSGGAELSIGDFSQMFVPGLAINFSGMALGFILGAIFSVKFKNRITIIIEIGLQNTALALLVAGTLLQNSEMEKPALVYAIFSFFSTFVFSWAFKYAFFKYKIWFKRLRKHI